MLFVLALTNTSFLKRYFTRFTNEILAALVSAIFIIEAIKALVHIFVDLDSKQHHDTALLSRLLAFGTYYIAMSLSRFRHSRYLFRWARELLSGFGPTIAIFSMSLFAVVLHGSDLDLLPVPA